MNFASLLPRIFTGAALLLILGFALYMGPGWFSLLACVFAALALWEFYSLFWPNRSMLGLKCAGIAINAILLGTAACGGSWSVAAGFAFAGIVLGIVYLILFSLDEHKADPRDIGLTLFGLVYVTIPVMLLVQLSLPQVLLLFAVAVAVDTGAYFAGNAWGRHKIWPKVSPKKSVEGCVAGMAASVLVCAGFTVFRDSGSGPVATVLLGVALALAAMLGDFFESSLKRRQGVKDSGSLLPGHGGVLDRLDSLLFLVPVYILIQTF